MTSVQRFCGACGAESVSDADLFCRSCGVALRSSSGSPRSDATDANLKKSMWHLLFLDIFSESRLPRLWFFLHWLTLLVVLTILAVVIGVTYDAAGGQDDQGLESASTGVAILIGVPIVFWLARRRFHDMNRSGWWCLAMIVPLIHLVAFGALLFVKGTDGPNDYGPKPMMPHPTMKESYGRILMGLLFFLVAGFLVTATLLPYIYPFLLFAISVYLFFTGSIGYFRKK